MGEYATYRGKHIKIGTCENMYYLRADQRDQIDGYDFALDVDRFRFRFPFPDEDDVEPGGFDPLGGVRVPGYKLPAELSGDEHHSIQFTSPAGYNLFIPCPEGAGGPDGFGPVDVGGIKVYRNGFRGYPVVSQQGFRGGQLVTMLRCGACGAIHRLDTIDDAKPVIEAFLEEAERKEYNPHNPGDGWGYANSSTHRLFLARMAQRISAGYGFGALAAAELPAITA